MQNSAKIGQCESAFPKNVAAPERSISLIAGGAMVGFALLRRNSYALPLLLGGVSFLTRGITGYCPVNQWLGRGCHGRNDEELRIVGRNNQLIDVVDEAGDESFPASDPPSYSPIRGVGVPCECD